MKDPVQTISGSNSPSVTELLAQLDKMIGGGKTSSTTQTNTGPDQGAIDQENLMLQKIFADINPDSLDAMVGNILERAKQTFGPAAIGANAGGIRSYSDTVLNTLRNEAMARAVGEASQAKIDAITKANNTAAGLVNARLNASKQSTQTQAGKTGPSTLGQAAGLLTLGSAGMSAYKKLKNIYDSNINPDEELASGGEGYINDAEVYAAGTEGGGITSVEAGSGGAGGISPAAAAAGSGASVVAPPAAETAGTTSGASTPVAASSEVMMDSSPFLAPDAMAEQTTLANQGLTGAGELAEVPMLALPSEADMTVLNQQAAQAFAGEGELANIPALGGGSLESAVAALPDAESMSVLSGEAAAGLEGAGELSQVPALTDTPAPGASNTASTEGLTSTTADATGASQVIGADVGTSIDQILAQQGIQPGTAMPPAVMDTSALGIDANTSVAAQQVSEAAPGVATGGSGAGGAITAADVIGADVGTPIEQILASQGIPQGAAMPAAVAEQATTSAAAVTPEAAVAESTPITNISALDTSIPDLGSLTSEANLGLEGAGELSQVPALTGGTVIPAAETTSAASGATSLGTSGAAAAGGEEAAAATGGAEAAGIGTATATAGIGAAMVADAQDIQANPQTNALTEIFGGFTGFGGIANSISDIFGGDDSPPTWQYNPDANTYHNSQTGEAVQGDVFADPNNGYSAVPTVNGIAVAQDDSGQYQLPEGFSSWSDVWDAKSSYDTFVDNIYSM